MHFPLKSAPRQLQKMLSSKSALFVILATCSIVAISEAINCYQQNVGIPKAKVIRNQLSCFAMFYPSEQISSFGGIANIPQNQHRKQELAKADGTCQRMEVSSK